VADEPADEFGAPVAGLPEVELEVEPEDDCPEPEVEPDDAEEVSVDAAGVETLGVETDGVDTLGADTVGADTRGADPGEAETDGVVTDGVVTDGVEPTGVLTLGTVTVGVLTLGTETVGTVTLGTVTDGVEPTGVEILGTVTDGVEMLGSPAAPLASDWTPRAVTRMTASSRLMKIDRRVMRSVTSEGAKTCEFRPASVGSVRRPADLRTLERPCRLGEVVARYRSVLCVPGATRLLTSALFGRLPQGMASLSILLLVRESTHSYVAAGLAVGAYTLANAAWAPVQGRLVDRFGQARVLVPSACAQATMLVALVVAANTGAHAAVLVVLAGAAGAFAPPIAPTVRALLRDVFQDPHVLDSAYALDAVLQEVIWTVGPLVVAVVIAAASPSAAVVLLGVIYVLGTSIFVSAPLARRSRGHRSAGERGSALASRELRDLLLPVLMMGISLGGIEVGLPSLALHAGSRPASGVLLAIWAIGSMLGGLWYGSRQWQAPMASRYRTLLMLAIVFTAPLIAARSIPEGLVCSLLAGLTTAPVFSCQYALVSRAVVRGTETEAFTWVSAALIGGLAAGTALGGAAIAADGVSAPFALSVVAYALAALMAVRLRDRVAQPA
jgi:MFS family permease